MPKGNTSLHYSKAIELNTTNFIKKSPTYQAKTVEGKNMYLNSKYEQVVKLKKQHWVLKGLPSEFKILSQSNWDVHPVNVTAAISRLVRNTYKVLVEGNSGPLIVEHRSTLGVQFEINSLYPETILILHNFLHKHLSDICVIV